MILVKFSGKAAIWWINYAGWSEMVNWDSFDDDMIVIWYWYDQEIWQLYGNDMMTRMMMTMKTIITITDENNYYNYHDMMIKYDMIRCDVICCDVIWHDMILLGYQNEMLYL